MARSEAVRGAIRQAVSVGVPVAAYGVSFGALAVAAGLDIWQTCVLSLLMFSGGSQFALIGVLATGGLAAWPAAIASSTLLGTRTVALLDAHGADHRRTRAEAPARGTLDDRRDHRRLDRPDRP